MMQLEAVISMVLWGILDVGIDQKGICLGANIGNTTRSHEELTAVVIVDTL
jgi:hypothetical protein